MGDTPGVVVIGSLHLDIMVTAPGRPRTGETMVGSAWSMKEGGKGGNQAIEAARHGASVSMVGAVGADDFGRRLLDHLALHNVDTTSVAVSADAASGMSVAMLDPTGDYGAIIVSGANLALGADAIEQAGAAIAAARVLVLQNEIPESANLAAAAAGHAAGCTVILNAAPVRTLPPELAQWLDILVVNAIEAEMLCGIVVDDLASAGRAAVALTDLVAQVIVTAGGAGLVRAVGGAVATSLAPHAVDVVSTHGAGDSFIGALAARLAVGDTVDAALRYANAAAALLVSTPIDRRQELGPAAVARLIASMGEPAA